MTRILIAVLLAAAPAFARGHDRDNEGWRDQIDSPEWYGEDQPGWPNAICSSGAATNSPGPFSSL